MNNILNPSGLNKLTIILFAVLAISCRSNNSDIEIIKEGKTIHIKGNLPQNVSKVQIQINSSRNDQISYYHEVSPHNPEYDELIREQDAKGWDIFYPVVDVSLTEDMRGIATFEESFSADYSVNGMFHKKIFQLNGDTMMIDFDQLSNWENNVYIQPAPSKMNSFYLTEKVSVTEGKIDKTYDLLSEDWSGEISILNLPDKQEIYKTTIEARDLSPTDNKLSQFDTSDFSRERLIASLMATVNFTLRCQDQSANNDTKGSLNLFYDLEAKTYRRPIWIWGQGPSIKVLLESAKISEVAQSIPADSLKRVAREIGEASLKLQEKDPSHPAYGIITSRWSENRGTLHENYGFEQYYSIADAQFLAGWGWIPLYKETGDERYLEGVKLLTETSGKLTRAFDIIPMDYMIRAGTWKDYALNEQGFGTEGMNELFKIDPNPKYQKIGDEYMKMLLEKFETEEGIWNRMYRIDEEKKIPTRYVAKSQGWATEGLLANYELTGTNMYLDKAEKIAKQLIKYQSSDGSWQFIYNSGDTNETAEKATAIWSVLFYKLYHHTQKENYLQAARKSLLWCLNNQYNGPDRLAHGGLVAVTRASGVIYRRWFPMECLYASGFFGLAVLEELALQEKGNDPDLRNQDFASENQTSFL